MNAPPTDLDPAVVAAALAAWGVHPQTFEYAPVGFGSHHWIACEAGDRRHFVTVDDLTAKPWLGADPDATFEGLGAAMDTAAALREAGLAFVVAPVPAAGGEVVLRLDRRYALTVLPFVTGRGAAFADEMPPDDLAHLVRILCDLHRSPPSARAVAPDRGLAMPGRAVLEGALADVDRAWAGGPFAEPAREWLAANEGPIRVAMATYDRLAGAVTSSGAAPVVTHGETHPGNVIRAEHGLVLVDWDTVAVAPPERDLWSLVRRSADVAPLYAEAAGRRLDPDALELYRLAWDLGDTAAYLAVYRATHERTPDTEKMWRHMSHPFEG